MIFAKAWFMSNFALKKTADSFFIPLLPKIVLYWYTLIMAFCRYTLIKSPCWYTLIKATDFQINEFLKILHVISLIGRTYSFLLKTSVGSKNFFWNKKVFELYFSYQSTENSKTQSILAFKKKKIGWYSPLSQCCCPSHGRWLILGGPPELATVLQFVEKWRIRQSQWPSCIAVCELRALSFWQYKLFF